MDLHRLLSALSDRKNRLSIELKIYLESKSSTPLLMGQTVGITWPKKLSWSPGVKWTENLLAGFKILSSLHFADIPQPEGSVIRFDLQLNGASFPMALDYSDYKPINRDIATQTLAYFKMQYDRQGYDLEQVIPGGFPPNDLLLYAHLRRLRQDRLQLGCLYDVYGRFGKGFAFESRQKCIESLRAQPHIKFCGGFEFVRYARSLEEASRARICIDLPGNGDFCFRLVDYLALGTCIIAYPHGNRFPCALEDRRHIVYMKEDMSDLIELVDYYLSHENERQAIGTNAAQYFDEHLSYKAIASYYLHAMISRASGECRHPCNCSPTGNR